MSGFLDKRLRAIEKRMAEAPVCNTIADAKAFTDAILRIADRFHDTDATMAASERFIRMSAAERLAWALRFGTPEEFDTAIADAVEMVG